MRLTTAIRDRLAASAGSNKRFNIPEAKQLAASVPAPWARVPLDMLERNGQRSVALAKVLAQVSSPREPSFQLTTANRDDFYSNSGDYVGKKILQPRTSSFASPFSVRPRSTLSRLESEIVSALDALSCNEQSREELFGSLRFNSQLVSGTSPRLSLAGTEPAGEFVEVGAYLIELENGDTVHQYVTSNVRNATDTYGVLEELLTSEIFPRGQNIRAIKFFHTHPVNLYLSIDDHVSTLDEFGDLVRRYGKELAACAALAPHKWVIYSQMEGEPCLFEGRVSDWRRPTR